MSQRCLPSKAHRCERGDRVAQVKICPLCGAKNPPMMPYCVSCTKQDLSPVQSVDDADLSQAHEASSTTGDPELRTMRVEDASQAITLELVEDPSVRFTVRDGQVVGRGQAADVTLVGVPRLPEISRQHARFTCRGTRWYVSHLGSVNYNIVDGERYDDDRDVPVGDGSTLVLAETPFVIRIGGL